ncbi:uncharacterized protein HD556DRAFT_1310750 [Suillus plorans]|uniref:KOW domain-containing protein n=1 Tax=Suillus plorans TaxID=116603 RepID=A0A9P7AKQ8_9AGAM|nr:uncharacterized protein HD556DRAFT_1310750 [Suillus plorans]KAG1790362.1 hypothetical protein HD556DRAFT_1310750 [Suillus plorans]
MGDLARVVKGSLHGELGQVISTDHTSGTVMLESAFDGCLKEIDICLQDTEHVFQVGDTVKVVAGSYLGLQGHIVQMCKDTFVVCQYAMNHQVEVSKYYLDQRLLDHIVQSQPQTQQHFEPPQSDSIEIGDFIEVLVGEHIGKCGIIDWFSKGDTKLCGRLSRTSVPIAAVQRTKLTQTLKFTKEKGYDVKPGDIVTVAHGPEYEAKGVIQSVDFPNAHLTLLCDGDHTLINVPIGFVVKEIGQEVFIVGGGQKGYWVTLYGLGPDLCTIALHGQKHITLKNCNIVMRFTASRYGKRLNGAMLEGLELISFCDLRKRLYLAPPPQLQSITPPIEKVPSSSLASITDSVPSSSSMWSTWSASTEGADVAHGSSSSVNPNSESSTSDPQTVSELDVQDSPLAWLMTREFSSTFFKYHMMLKVSPIFDVSLSRRFVSMPCPDPFCGKNGPTPEGCIAAYCTSNNAGAILKHYHIPAIHLSPAPPCKKNQECLILDGPHRGLIQSVAKCSIKHSSAEFKIMPTVTVILHFDQICLVELMS